MTHVARYAKAIAKPGAGDRLAELMLKAAESVRKAPGCELYIVNRVPGEPDTLWVTELWASPAALDAALAAAKADDEGLIAQVMDLVIEFSRIDLDPIGGVGLDPDPQPGWERVNLRSLYDEAAGYGLGGIQEMRTPVKALGLQRTGLSLQYILPDQRQAFGHTHANAEETYVVLSGAGTLRVGDDEVPLSTWDAVRVAPTLTRAFAAGPEGMEYLALGPRHRGDGEMLPGWWGQDGRPQAASGEDG